MQYRIFDVGVDSDISLDELPQGWPPEVSEASVRVRLGTPAGFRRAEFSPSMEWPDGQGKVICTVARKHDAYFFSFPGYADFHISASGHIHSMPGPECTPQLLRHFLVNQIIPRLLGSNGSLLVHASAVQLPEGPVLAFVGRSGFGKSTLAASFHQAGARLLADDCLLLAVREGRVAALGAFPGLRLAQGMAEQIYGSNAGFMALTHSGKEQIHFPLADVQAKPAWLPLDLLALLTEPASGTSEIAITPGDGPSVVKQLLRSVFTLDPAAEQSTIAAFKGIGGVIDSGLNVVRLQYPRSLSALPAVHKLLQGRLRLA